MVSSKAATVDAYLAEQPPERRAALETIRAVINESVPGIQEKMTYGMPTFELDQVVVALAAQKNYFSLYMDTELVEKHKAELGTADCGKSCVRFTNLDKLNLDTVRKILKETVQKQSAS